MYKEFVTAYKFVKVDEHKSPLLIKVTDLEKLEAAIADPVATEWDKKNNCNDTVYKIELVEKLNALMPRVNQQVLRLRLV